MKEYMMEHEKQSNINQLFIFEKKPTTLWGKISNKLSLFTSPLLFAGGVLSAYTLYHHSNFFQLITSQSFYLLIFEILTAAILSIEVSRGYSLLKNNPHSKKDQSIGKIHLVFGLIGLIIDMGLMFITQ